MTTAGQHNTIEKRFKNQWGSTTVVEYMNVDFTPPANAAFVKLEISDIDSNQITTGCATNLFRTIGFINITILLPVGSGPLQMRTYADQIMAIFRNWSSDGIVCMAPKAYLSGNRVGKVTLEYAGQKRDWMRGIVEVPYRRDEYL